MVVEEERNYNTGHSFVGEECAAAVVVVDGDLRRGSNLDNLLLRRVGVEDKEALVVDMNLFLLHNQFI